jgi:hypothetical protein
MKTSATLNDWRPNDIFFDLLSGEDVVLALLADIGSPAAADGKKGEATKVQKGIIMDFLHGTNGRERALPRMLTVRGVALVTASIFSPNIPLAFN